MPSSESGKPKMSPEREQKGFSVVHRRQMGMCRPLLSCFHRAPSLSRGWGGVSGVWEAQFAVAELVAAPKAPEGGRAASLGIAEPTVAPLGSVLGGEEVRWLSLPTPRDAFPLCHPTRSQPRNPNACGQVMETERGGAVNSCPIPPSIGNSSRSCDASACSRGATHWLFSLHQLPLFQLN